MISSLDDSMRIPYLRGGRNMSDFPKGVVLENSLLSAPTESERVRPGALDKSALSHSIEQELLRANTIKEAIVRDNSVMVAPTEQEQEQKQEQVQNEALEKSVTLTPTEQELLRANTIKEAMAHTWKGYETFAFGHDELKPGTGGYDDRWDGHPLDHGYEGRIQSCPRLRCEHPGLGRDFERRIGLRDDHSSRWGSPLRRGPLGRRDALTKGPRSHGADASRLRPKHGFRLLPCGFEDGTWV